MQEQQLREDLARRGLGGTARAAELMRRTRAEAGPSYAQAFTNVAIQAALANAQARRQGMGALAGAYMQQPYWRDYTPELQLLSERERFGAEMTQREQDVAALLEAMKASKPATPPSGNVATTSARGEQDALEYLKSTYPWLA
jgi:hypothetical protein